MYSSWNGISWNSMAYSGDSENKKLPPIEGAAHINVLNFCSLKGLEPVSSLNIVTPRLHQSTALVYPTFSALVWDNMITISGAM